MAPPQPLTGLDVFAVGDTEFERSQHTSLATAIPPPGTPPRSICARRSDTPQYRSHLANSVDGSSARSRSRFARGGRCVRSRLAGVRFVQRWGGPERATDLGLPTRVDEAEALAPPCSVSASRSSDRTCGFAASVSPTGFTSRPTGAPDSAPCRRTSTSMACRVERARQMQGDLSPPEGTACASFSDQSQFSYPLKCLVGVTPRQFQRRFWPQEKPR